MTNDPAVPRYFAIQLVRLGGAVMIAAGLGAIAGKLALPGTIGIALVLIGLLAFAWVPVLLARRWKSPPE